MTDANDHPTVVFMHGALVCDGEWWWRPTAELLFERAGIRSRAVALPSCGEAPPPAGTEGLVADAAALRAVLDEFSRASAIVVGHSYGGTVIAEAGQHPAVAHLLAISSYLPEAGLSQGAIMSGESDSVTIGDNGDGTLSVSGYDAASFGARFLHDADEATRHHAWERVTAQSVAAFVTPTSAVGWEGVDSTYIVCSEDRSTSLALQREHASRATRSVEVPTGHHPFVTRPDLVVEQIEAMLASG
ncbi:MAG: alpha/beta hydrolase [Herbiconiux sp.]|uniref:alpha/beta fold hydrolase n=1 Tax=Herbiconiux sp. TaxID=1871186 RepID=UPI001217236D|nr:alpha/beta hydrolase [Herbiconiux sp.]TAJ46643.1 MAG: alpha/beta hydrolase [Herbiconiux sp.]